jgi:mono/diheme cytochrome c family protein
MKTSILILACLISRPGLLAAGESVDYVRDVRPILAKHCASCHGAARPKGGLRLDTAAAALKGGDGGPAVVPGNAEESPLIDAVTSEDVSARMPLKRPPLTPAQVATLRAWIDQGAVAPAGETPDPTFGTHWAFLPPSRPDLPVVKAPAWCRNPIDRFVLARLDREGVRPSLSSGCLPPRARSTPSWRTIGPTPMSD